MLTNDDRWQVIAKGHPREASGLKYTNVHEASLQLIKRL